MSSFLQKIDWMGFQRSLGRRVFEYDKDGIKAKVIRHDLPLGKSYLYIPRGPEVDFNSMMGGENNPIRNFIGWLKEAAKREKAIFIKIEPSSDHVAQVFSERGFRRSKKEIQPSKTVILNLENEPQVLLDSMHHKTRYNIKIAQSRGVAVEESDDINAFWKLMKKTTERDRFSSHPKDYYFKLLDNFKSSKSDGLNQNEISTKLFLAKIDDKLIAGAIVLVSGDVGYYLHGASDYQYRQNMAPFLLHWHIKNYLKNIGLKKYDLWGIDSKKWPGVTRFKLQWGGRVVEYPGSFDLTISRYWNILYKVFRTIFKK